MNLVTTLTYSVYNNRVRHTHGFSARGEGEPPAPPPASRSWSPEVPASEFSEKDH